jgi:hypothetical protein
VRPHSGPLWAPQAGSGPPRLHSPPEAGEAARRPGPPLPPQWGAAGYCPQSTLSTVLPKTRTNDSEALPQFSSHCSHYTGYWQPATGTQWHGGSGTGQCGTAALPTAGDCGSAARPHTATGSECRNAACPWGCQSLPVPLDCHWQWAHWPRPPGSYSSAESESLPPPLPLAVPERDCPLQVCAFVPLAVHVALALPHSATMPQCH